MIGDHAMRMHNARPEEARPTRSISGPTGWNGPACRSSTRCEAVRTNLAASLKLELSEFLDASLAAGLASLPEVARQTTVPGWNPEQIEAYLRRFHYRLGRRSEGLPSRFEELLNQHGLIDTD